MLLGSYYLYKKTNSFINKLSFYGIVRKLPYIKGYINNKIAIAIDDVNKEFKVNDHIKITTIPEHSTSITDIKSLHHNYKSLRKYNYEEGKVSGTVYLGNNLEYTNLMIDTVREFIFSNPLHPDIFPDIRIMESEVISMVSKIFNGNEGCCGNMTNGGTESILLACKTYRDWGIAVKNITSPEIIVGESTHASFDKAGHYFNIKIVKVPIDLHT